MFSGQSPLPKAVLFDVDGTLVDSLKRILLGMGDAIEEFTGNRPEEQELRGLIGMSLESQMRLYAPSADEHRITEMSMRTIYYYELHKKHDVFFQPAVDALTILQKAGVPTGLVTSKNRDEMAVFMQTFPAGDKLKAAVNASDVTHPKPSPEPVLLACQQIGVYPEEAVMIGDSIYDLRSAKAASARSIAVTYGSSPRSVLESENPDLILERPEDVYIWATKLIETTQCQPIRKI